METSLVPVNQPAVPATQAHPPAGPPPNRHQFDIELLHRRPGWAVFLRILRELRWIAALLAAYKSPELVALFKHLAGR